MVRRGRGVAIDDAPKRDRDRPSSARVDRNRSGIVTTTAQGEVARGELVVLREKRLADAPDDYRWRTDPELAKFDAARPFAASYPDYLSLYRDELSYPSPYRRSVAIEDSDGHHIGNAMYYNIDAIRREAEI